MDERSRRKPRCLRQRTFAFGEGRRTTKTLPMVKPDACHTASLRIDGSDGHPLRHSIMWWEQKALERCSIPTYCILATWAVIGFIPYPPVTCVSRCEPVNVCCFTWGKGRWILVWCREGALDDNHGMRFTSVNDMPTLCGKKFDKPGPMPSVTLGVNYDSGVIRCTCVWV